MIAFFRCVAESVAENGLSGLAEMVPGGKFACAVAAGAWKKYRERMKDVEIREEIQRLAQVSFDEARNAAVEAVKAAATPDATPEQQLSLELYLSQVPSAVRASLKRPEDVSGKTVPPSFSLNSPDDVLKLLPARPPRFKPNDPLPGLLGWSLVELLGVGGFGEVWLARHRSMSSLSGAVKFCHGEQARDLKHESGLIDRVMSAGQHQNIVPLKNVHLEGETPWLMFDYVQGGDLADLIRKWQTLDAEKRVRSALVAMKQLSAAVAHFHRLMPPIVHRDLKPANILVDRERKVLRITDFGIGSVTSQAALADEASGGATVAGRLLSSMHGSHTPLYSSPQQRAGSAPDPRDDVHALGVIGYQIITGHLTQGAGPDFADDLRDSGASDELIALLGRCVASKPDRRPANAVELSTALARLDVPQPSVPSQPVPPVVVVTPPIQQVQEAKRQVDELPRAATSVATPEPGRPLRQAAPHPRPPHTNTVDEPENADEYWFVNVGEHEARDWDDCKEIGFLSAGYGARYSNAMKRLPLGAKVFAYMKALGYVGYGIVTSTAVMARDFVPHPPWLPLLDIPDLRSDIGHDLNDEDEADWVVGIRWHKTFDREDAKRFPGAFANQNVVCKLRDEATLKFLCKEFGVPTASEPSLT